MHRGRVLPAAARVAVDVVVAGLRRGGEGERPARLGRHLLADAELLGDERVDPALEVRGGVRGPEVDRHRLAGPDGHHLRLEAGHAHADRHRVGRRGGAALAEEIPRRQDDAAAEDTDDDQAEQGRPVATQGIRRGRPGASHLGPLGRSATLAGRRPLGAHRVGSGVVAG